MQVLCRCGRPLATGFERVVHGERGAYVEFTDAQIIQENLCLPEGTRWRLSSSIAYYDEYRTQCPCNEKVYHQRRTVKYADYKVGYWYVAQEACRGLEGLGMTDPYGLLRAIAKAEGELRQAEFNLRVATEEEVNALKTLQAARERMETARLAVEKARVRLEKIGKSR